MSNAVRNSPTAVFFNPIGSLKIDEGGKTAYSTSQTIDTLIQELKEKGPLVACGKIGPNWYSSEPFPLKNKFGGEQIFGWRPDSRASKVGSNTHAVVVGARKLNGKEYVYFKLSKASTTDPKDYLRMHHPTSDRRIFVSSHESFREHLFDAFPPAKEADHPNLNTVSSMQRSDAEMVYVKQLASIMPMEEILGGREEAVKALGQKIFDEFKEAAGGSSSAGFAAVVNICDTIRSCAKDGYLRGQYIERAWDGIGDDIQQWRA